MRYKINILRGQKKAEIVFYAALWIVIFMLPVLFAYLNAAADERQSFNWTYVLDSWGLVAMFCVTFFIHNFLLAPLLVYANRRWLYAGLALLLLGCFLFYQCNVRPNDMELRHYGGRMEMEMEMREPPGGRMPMPPAGEPPALGERPPMPDGEMGPEPRIFGGQDMVASVIMLLLIALNLGVKTYLKSIDDRKRMQELERRNLSQQLEYLKYQINPHFFMNTLNNIHALVDINPERAKETIEVLSRLMRYVLYDSNKPLVPLADELRFLRNYIDLMQIRYNSDLVKVTVRIPDCAATRKVPPLIFISFVENAFKHGVSYERPSFVTVSVRTDDKSFDFHCRNSRKPGREEASGGLGLRNTEKRLRLVYGSDFTLAIDSGDDYFDVCLHAPLLDDKKQQL